MRSLGGTKFAKNAIENSKYLDSKGKKEALDENAYLSAKKKANKTGGQITYDVSTGKYTVSDGDKKGLSDNQKTAIKVGAAAAGTALAAYGAMKLSNSVRDNVYNHKVQRGLNAVQNAIDKGARRDLVESMMSDVMDYKKESLVRSVRNTIDNNRVGKNIDYKNVYKILSGK